MAKPTMSWMKKVDAAPTINLAAFGKHPGWDDHIDELGFDSERLVECRRLLYAEGISGVIDSGEWEKLEGEKRLPGFGHAFAWKFEDGLLIGRMWASRDGKGRTKYPMVVVADCQGVPTRWALKEVLSVLEGLEARCTQATKAEEVRAILDAARARLRESVTGVHGSIEDLRAESGDAVRRLVERQEWGDVGLFRVLYEMERELGQFREAESRSKTRVQAMPAQALRAPAFEADAAETLLAWLGVIEREIETFVRVLVVRPHGRPWADVIVGHPGPPELKCLLATSEAVPLASEVPYSLDEPFMAQARAKVDAWCKGEAPPVAPRPAPAAAAPGERSRPKWLIPAIVGGVALLVILGVLAMNSGKAKPAAPTVPPEPPRPEVRVEPPPTPVVQVERPAAGDAWERLCAEMDWFYVFAYDQGFERARAETGRQDATFAKVEEMLNAARVQPLDPWRIAGQEVGETEIASLKANRPEGARGAEADRRIAAALAVVDGVRAELEAWPPAASVSAAAGAIRAGAERFRAPGIAEAGAQAVEAAVLYANALAGADASLVEAVRRVNAASQRIGDLASTLDALTKLSDRFKGSGDAVVARFDELVRAEAEALKGGAGGLSELAARLAEVRGLADRLAARLFSERFDAEAFHEEGAFAALKEAPVGRAAFNEWLALAQQGRFDTPTGADPREAWLPTARAAVDAAERLKADYEELARRDPQGSAAENYSARIAGLRESIGAVSAVKRRTATEPEIRAAMSAIDTEAASLSAAINRSKNAVQERLSLASQRIEDFWNGLERKLPGAPADANAAWSRGLDDLKARAGGSVQTASDMVKAWRARFEEIENALSAESHSLRAPWLKPDMIDRAVARRRAEAFSRGAAALPGAHEAIREGAPPVGPAAREHFAAFLRDAGAVVGALDEVQRGLAAGIMPGDGERGAALAARFAEAERSGAYAELKDAASAVIERVERLRAIAGENDAAKLVAEVQRSGADRLAEASAAWRRLGDLPSWPGTLAQLRQELELSRQMKQLAGSAADADRRNTLLALVQAEGARRWSKAFEAVLAADAARAAEVAALRGEFGVTEADLAKLHPASRFALLRLDLLAEADRLGAPEREGELKQRILAFVNSARGLGAGVADRPAVAKSLAELNAMATGAAKPPPDPAKLGPGRLGWRAEVQDAGRRVSYTRPAEGDSPELTIDFVRVEFAGPNGPEASYLAENEVSVGVFIELARGGKWEDVLALLPRKSGLDDPRSGPRVWDWGGGQVRRSEPRRGSHNPANLSNGWLRNKNAMENTRYYPDDLAVAPPRDNDPMQHISLGAAVYTARLAGCRLPTAAEWRAALEAAGGAARSDVNLRDQTWRRAWDFIREMASKDPELPNGGIFRPSGFTVPQTADSETHALDDKTLWFFEVDRGSGPFRNLIGNVAEFVFERPEALESLPLGSPTIGEVNAALGGGEPARVLGGSALSPPAIDPETPHEVAVGTVALSRTYSDVGFRLAFSIGEGPPKPIAQQMRDSLSGLEGGLP